MSRASMLTEDDLWGPGGNWVLETSWGPSGRDPNEPPNIRPPPNRSATPPLETDHAPNTGSTFKPDDFRSNQLYHRNLWDQPSRPTTYEKLSRYPTESYTNIGSPLTAWDGKVAACNGDSSWVITSPNATYIPSPPMYNRVVQLRMDNRFGKDDPILWPQPLMAKDYPWFAAIPAVTNDVNDPLWVMWDDPHPRHFIPSPSPMDSLQQLGNLSPTYLTPLLRLRNELVERVQAFLKDPIHPPAVGQMRATLRFMSIAYSRLEQLAANYDTIYFTLVEFQRYYLYLRGMLDFTLVHLPIALGKALPATDVVKRMGAFVHADQDAQYLFDMGLPVWQLRKSNGIALKTVIEKHVQVINADEGFLCVEPNPRFPVLYQGKSDDPARIRQMNRFTLTRTVHRSPFSEQIDPLSITARPAFFASLPLSDLQSQDATVAEFISNKSPSERSQTFHIPHPYPVSTASSSSQTHTPSSARTSAAFAAQASSTSSPRTSASSSPHVSPGPSTHRPSTGPSRSSPPVRDRPLPYAKSKGEQLGATHPTGGKEKFKEPTHRCNPPTRPAWTKPVENLEKLPQPKKRFDSDGRYAYPNPHFFLSSDKDQKMNDYLFGWALIRNFAIFRYGTTADTCEALGSQSWKSVCGVSLYGMGGGNRKRSTDSTSAFQAFGVPKAQMDGFLALARESAGATVPILGRTISRKRGPDDRLAMKMIWELYELNFRMELAELDSRCISDKAANLDQDAKNDLYDRRQELIARCFPGVYSLVNFDASSASCGLVSKHWDVRRAHLAALAVLMADWVEKVPPEFNQARRERLNEEQTLTLENAVARVYVETFYSKFGRAPIIPHTL